VATNFWTAATLCGSRPLIDRQYNSTLVYERKTAKLNAKPPKV